jgi:hypothetical protein
MIPEKYQHCQEQKGPRMDEDTKQQLTNMLKLTTKILSQNDLYTIEDASAIQAYASCQIALQLDRIAWTLEQMHKQHKLAYDGGE